jgi:hypothetical protein
MIMNRAKHTARNGIKQRLPSVEGGSGGIKMASIKTVLFLNKLYIK